MKFSRFERKILTAIVAVAVLPMVGALVLGQAALREAYEVGVNDRVGAQLQRGLSLYEAHFRALRQNADQAATALTNDRALYLALQEALAIGAVGAGGAGGAGGAAQDAGMSADRAGTAGDSPAASAAREALSARLQALLDSYGGVAAVGVRAGSLSVRASRAERLAEGMRTLEMVRPLGDSGASLELTLSTPAAAFADYQRAGELAEVYGRLSDNASEVASFYLLVYMGFLASAIVLSVAAGIVLSRRVTRRVLQLAEATRRVGAGDLDVHVPSDDDDEVAELTRDFNAMVRDIRESRVRIEYLQRIGAWQELARHLAHEIKNPLTPIQLAVQEVDRSYRGDDEAFRRRLSDATTIVEEEVASLRRMVGEFSAFARLPVADLQESDLGDFLSDAAVTLGSLPEEFASEPALRSEVQIVAPPEAVAVAIDAMMLKRCLDNLVRNALQALRDAGRAGHVEVSGRVEGPWALIEVSDDGPGIGDDALPQVFDPYFTTKADGTGLGLPVVMKIVLEHHGELGAERSPQGGALLRIQLPRAGTGNTKKNN